MTPVATEEEDTEPGRGEEEEGKGHGGVMGHVTERMKERRESFAAAMEVRKKQLQTGFEQGRQAMSEYGRSTRERAMSESFWKKLKLELPSLPKVEIPQMPTVAMPKMPNIGLPLLSRRKAKKPERDPVHEGLATLDDLIRLGAEEEPPSGGFFEKKEEKRTAGEPSDTSKGNSSHDVMSHE